MTKVELFTLQSQEESQNLQLKQTMAHWQGEIITLEKITLLNLNLIFISQQLAYGLLIIFGKEDYANNLKVDNPNQHVDLNLPLSRWHKAN